MLPRVRVHILGSIAGYCAGMKFGIEAPVERGEG